MRHLDGTLLHAGDATHPIMVRALNGGLLLHAGESSELEWCINSNPHRIHRTRRGGPRRCRSQIHCAHGSGCREPGSAPHRFLQDTDGDHIPDEYDAFSLIENNGPIRTVMAGATTQMVLPRCMPVDPGDRVATFSRNVEDGDGDGWSNAPMPAQPITGGPISSVWVLRMPIRTDGPTMMDSWVRGDRFPTNWKQALDSDGDGLGDNHGPDCCNTEFETAQGDLFPLNVRQWEDLDGDGWGDNGTDSVTGDQCPGVTGFSFRDRNGCLDTDGDRIQ